MIIGLTGGIASGKSTVSNMLKELGLPVVDADVIAREVVEIDQPAYKKIIAVFGNEVLTEDRNINRPYLGSIIFHDEKKRKQLNEIVHPEVRKVMLERVKQNQLAGKKDVILDIPLLFESKLTHLVDKIMLVYVDYEKQLGRLIARNHLSEEEAKARIMSQIPLKEKISLSDEIINNNGSLKATKEQLIQILEKWRVFVS